MCRLCLNHLYQSEICSSATRFANIFSANYTNYTKTPCVIKGLKKAFINISGSTPNGSLSDATSFVDNQSLFFVCLFCFLHNPVDPSQNNILESKSIVILCVIICNCNYL